MCLLLHADMAVSQIRLAAVAHALPFRRKRRYFSKCTI
jgi:hypothetical protein